MALPAPNSPVDICNLALTLLNEDFVTDIDVPPVGDDTAALCKLHYPQVRRAGLRAHPWNFAIDRIVLAKDSTSPAFGFANRYEFPPQFLRYLSKHDELGNVLLAEPVEGTDYQIESDKSTNSRYILTGTTTASDDALRMRYIFDNEVVSSWDPLFIDYISHTLALRLARHFKSAPRSIADIKDSLREIKAEAKAIDGQERPPIRKQDSKFLRARRNRSSSVAGKFTRIE